MDNSCGMSQLSLASCLFTTIYIRESNQQQSIKFPIYWISPITKITSLFHHQIPWPTQCWLPAAILTLIQDSQALLVSLLCTDSDLHSLRQHLLFQWTILCRQYIHHMAILHSYRRFQLSYAKLSHANDVCASTGIWLSIPNASTPTTPGPRYQRRLWL